MGEAMHEDLRVTKTRNAIRSALHDLVLETDPDKITVKAITDRAQISRKTFYLHYDSIEALLDEEMQRTMDIFFIEHEETPELPEDIEGHARRFFLFLSKQDRFVERLVCSRTYYDFGGKLYQLQMARYKEAGNPFEWLGPREELVLHFIRSSALQFYRRWVRMGKTVPVDEAADLLAELTFHGVSGLMK
jgi:AcrR family transcriptional regulator